jgi:phosphate/sulfate permease
MTSQDPPYGEPVAVLVSLIVLPFAAGMLALVIVVRIRAPWARRAAEALEMAGQDYDDAGKQKGLGGGGQRPEVEGDQEEGGGRPGDASPAEAEDDPSAASPRYSIQLDPVSPGADAQDSPASPSGIELAALSGHSDSAGQPQSRQAKSLTLPTMRAKQSQTHSYSPFQAFGNAGRGRVSMSAADFADIAEEREGTLSGSHLEAAHVAEHRLSATENPLLALFVKSQASNIQPE